MTTASILLTITILSSLQQQPDAFTLIPSHPIPTPTIRQSLHNNHNHPHQNDNTNQRPQRHGSILTTRFAALSIPVYSNIDTQSNVTSTTTTTPIPIKTQKTMMTPPAATAVAILPHCIESSVLKKVYPAILKHVEEYGNPNIPLGTKDGSRCRILRRMAFQETLTPAEIELLTKLDFRWNSFEDVYEEADFDACLNRLLKYEEEQKTNYQIPKKYHPDPELGAWVTLIRRIGKANIESSRRDQLDAIGFAWKSTRKCGSAFMGAYKALKVRLQSVCRITSLPEADEISYELIDPVGLQTILEEDAVQKWLRSTKVAMKEGKLSDSRCLYMDSLPGFDWRGWGEEES